MNERGLSELYLDPPRADDVLFSRRKLLAGGLTLSMRRLLGAAVTYARFIPVGVVPASLAQSAPDSV
ncbi:MAG: molybdopterin containing oxidoreductase, partial [Gammaproteobacteria bacterium]|nr:molybdopterin containing oxidoreductase [Gammaproteobacteria bacterium]